MGGTQPNSTDCDVPPIYGMHNMYLGKQNPEDAMWAMFRSNLTSYEVPSEIISVIGGSYVSRIIASAHLTLTSFLQCHRGRQHHAAFWRL